MAAAPPAFTGNLKKVLAGLRRINLDGLRWRVFDANGKVLGWLAIPNSCFASRQGQANLCTTSGK
ncbi:hypothetical protein GUJ93_ZPchr0008g13205, partial [Zizania palustris]